MGRVKWKTKKERKQALSYLYKDIFNPELDKIVNIIDQYYNNIGLFKEFKKVKNKTQNLDLWLKRRSNNWSEVIPWGWKDEFNYNIIYSLIYFWETHYYPVVLGTEKSELLNWIENIKDRDKGRIKFIESFL